MGIGDWDWGLGPIPNPQSPIPNPQSPFYSENIYIKIFLRIKKIIKKIIIFIIYYNSLYIYLKLNPSTIDIILSNCFLILEFKLFLVESLDIKDINSPSTISDIKFIIFN